MKRSIVVRVAAAALLAVGLLTPVPAAADDVVSGIDGTVTVDGGVPWTGTINVSVSLDPGGTTYRVATDHATGTYSLDVPPGRYRVRFHYVGTENLVGSYHGGPRSDQHVYVTVISGQRTENVDQTIYAGTVMTGSLVGEGGVLLTAPQVRAYYPTGVSVMSQPRTTIDRANGTYTIDRLTEGPVVLSYSGGEGWIPEWWDGERSGATAETISVPRAGALTVNLDLAPAFVISGNVTLTSGLPAAYTGITLFDASGIAVASTSSGADGYYFFNVVAAGTYSVCARPDGGYWGCWGGATLPADATPIELGAGGRPGIDFVVQRASFIFGTVTARLDPSGEAVPFTASVALYEEVPSAPGTFRPFEETVAWDGSYYFGYLVPGNYLIRVSDPNGTFVTEWWEDARFQKDADPITVLEGENYVSTIELSADGPEVTRIGGDSRYSTGVLVSRFAHPEASPDVPVVYIASGANFPDALSAGPAAVHEGGTLLLVAPDAIPVAVRTELIRLSPERIVVVGSSDSIGPAVFEQLAELVDSPDNLIRIGGPNRYETSAMIARYAFDGPNDDATAFIANGGNFPDALSAGPAAAQSDGPVLLVDGSAASPSAGIVDLVSDLGVGELVIVGGAPGMNQAQAAAIASQTGVPTTRIAGVDRYATSLRLAEYSSNGEWLFLAAGLGFPDALVGGPAAYAFDAPLVLSPTDCVAPGTVEYVADADVAGMVVLGSTASLSDRVANLIPCS